MAIELIENARQFFKPFITWMSASPIRPKEAEHQNSDAGAEIAAVHRDEKLKRHDARQSAAGGVLVRLSDAGPLGDLRLQDKQRRRGENQPRHQPAELIGKADNQQSANQPADDARWQEPLKPLLVMHKLPPVAPRGGENSGDERCGAGLIGHHRGKFLGTQLMCEHREQHGKRRLRAAAGDEFTRRPSPPTARSCIFPSHSSRVLAVCGGGFQVKATVVTPPERTPRVYLRRPAGRAAKRRRNNAIGKFSPARPFTR